MLALNYYQSLVLKRWRILPLVRIIRSPDRWLLYLASNPSLENILGWRYPCWFLSGSYIYIVTQHLDFSTNINPNQKKYVPWIRCREHGSENAGKSIVTPKWLQKVIIIAESYSLLKWWCLGGGPGKVKRVSLNRRIPLMRAKLIGMTAFWKGRIEFFQLWLRLDRQFTYRMFLSSNYPDMWTNIVSHSGHDLSQAEIDELKKLPGVEVIPHVEKWSMISYLRYYRHEIGYFSRSRIVSGPFFNRIFNS